jgi:hypothetical protein
MLDSSKVLAGLPAGLRDPLLNAYEKIVTNFAEHRWEPAELNGGKFSEVVYTILLGYLHGTFAAKPSKPKDMVSACRALESTPPSSVRVGDHSMRILIPRMLLGLYDIRNNRGVGHAGGDVDPNFMDASAVYAMASWVMAELVRVFHSIGTQEAQETVDLLVERKISLVWAVEKVRRVQDPTMRKEDQALVLLYSKPAWVAEQDLHQWVEYSTASMFRKNILVPLHKARLIEFDAKGGRARISPLGAQQVERNILKTSAP